MPTIVRFLVVDIDWINISAMELSCLARLCVCGFKETLNHRRISTVLFGQNVFKWLVTSFFWLTKPLIQVHCNKPRVYDLNANVIFSMFLKKSAQALSESLHQCHSTGCKGHVFYRESGGLMLNVFFLVPSKQLDAS